MTEHDKKLLRLAFQMAHVKGMEAVRGMTPTPMVVGSPSTPFGNDVDPSKPTYFVEGGVCGFAWVNIRPATSAVAKFAESELGWRYNDYDRAMQKWIGEFGQSMQRKEAYADAFATELSDNLKLLGYDKVRVSSNSRMD
jgi:hypothetical protein